MKIDKKLSFFIILALILATENGFATDSSAFTAPATVTSSTPRSPSCLYSYYMTIDNMGMVYNYQQCFDQYIASPNPPPLCPGVYNVSMQWLSLIHDCGGGTCNINMPAVHTSTCSTYSCSQPNQNFFIPATWYQSGWTDFFFRPYWVAPANGGQYVVPTSGSAPPITTDHCAYTLNNGIGLDGVLVFTFAHY